MGFTGAWVGWRYPLAEPLEGLDPGLCPGELGEAAGLSTAYLQCALVSGFQGLQARSELWPCAHVLR